MDYTAENFRELRLKANLTQKECAKLLRVNRTTVWRWEDGRSKIHTSIFAFLEFYISTISVDNYVNKI